MLLPECLDDWINEENPVRVIDAFVDALDQDPLRSIACGAQRSAENAELTSS